ncbi:hypothetical protein PAPYR_3548 [Paratrimastix pyriformis]|uniref:Uncharacterized protein n=1 Tax=Paratrimastix pyriformis TaxID=342808 RepID=A0ABQ8UNZ8_9EUKA|nr:hypothetical protein PAPYR_3548 [Paratrimastix pyriformis]|eukprot:GAFH01002274.1.p1 GENE.GAFH01002274.1~~GAFH01002274.1.p1  ORF type:complete len:371 (+),score=92.29 GAFH01002274.1:23-1135(+)
MGFVTAEVEVKCGLCGQASDITVAEDVTGGMRSSELDLRSSTTSQILHTQIHQCSHCNYCAPRIENTPENADEVRALIRTPAYTHLLQDEAISSDVARQFLCASLIQEQVAKDVPRAAQFALRAAWACDDDRAMAPARVCREKAAALYEQVIAKGIEPRGNGLPDINASMATLIDIYRRLGRFDRALALCDQLERATAGRSSASSRFHDDDDDEDAATHNLAVMRRLALYQRHLCADGDQCSYTLRDAADFEREVQQAARGPAGEPKDSKRPSKQEEEEEEDDDEDEEEEDPRRGRGRGGMPRGGGRGFFGMPFGMPFGFGGRGGDDDEEEEDDDDAPPPMEPQRRPAPQAAKPPPPAASPASSNPDEID